MLLFTVAGYLYQRDFQFGIQEDLPKAFRAFEYATSLTRNMRGRFSRFSRKSFSKSSPIVCWLCKFALLISVQIESTEFVTQVPYHCHNCKDTFQHSHELQMFFFFFYFSFSTQRQRLVPYAKFRKEEQRLLLFRTESSLSSILTFIFPCNQDQFSRK